MQSAFHIDCQFGIEMMHTARCFVPQYNVVYAWVKDETLASGMVLILIGWRYRGKNPLRPLFRPHLILYRLDATHPHMLDHRKH
jgi:hypothetical protein